jgi:inorganic pyrophosphatase/exopolyphosphatase
MVELLTCGNSPDLDGVSSAIAYGEILQADGRKIYIGFEGKVQLDAQFFVEQLGLTLNTLPSHFDKVRLLDVSALLYTPAVVQKHPELVVEVIDHRLIHNAEIDFPLANKIVIEQVGACATIVTEMAYSQPLLLSNHSASMLHGAIHSNTLNLQSSVTTKRDINAVAFLEKNHDINPDMVEMMFAYRTVLTEEGLLFALQNDFQAHHESPEGKVGIFQLEVLDAPELFADFMDIILKTLNDQKLKNGLDFVFLTAPSIRQECNYIVAADIPTANLIESHLGTRLIDPNETTNLILKTNKLLLRKEIVPLLNQLPS